MSQIIPIDVCKLRETNENEVELTVKFVEQKKAKVQFQSKVIREEVDNLGRRHTLLEKQLKCSESINHELESGISILKSKTHEAACSLERINWKMYKTEMLKEFENKINEITNQKKAKYIELLEPKSLEEGCKKLEILNYEQCSHKNKTNKSLYILHENIVELTEEIDKKKRYIKMTDPKLNLDIQMLEKRNEVLLLRYKRQLQEAESRLRQMNSELNSLENLSSEKEKLFNM